MKEIAYSMTVKAMKEYLKDMDDNDTITIYDEDNKEVLDIIEFRHYKSMHNLIICVGER